MKKRVISVLMIIVLLAGVLSVNALAAGGLSNFSKVRTYSGQFTDVPASQWYADEVQLVYEYGLIDGLTSTTFGPDENLTIAQAIKLAAVLHSIYNTGTSTLTNGSPWYQTYVDYALENGIIASGYSNYNTTATRADFAIIFAGAFPAEALTAINNISSGAIPDVSYSYSYGPAVYLLYRAGILTGSGADHAFHPNDSIKRSEVSAIAARMANSGFRQSFSMTATELTATEIAAQCSPAVFYIVVFDGNGNAFKSGSGFFINSTGLAVTNYHVIEGASSALIMTTDDEVYDVTGVYDYNEEYDLALLQVDGSGFPFLPIGDSDTVVQGATVYAIGNPQGMTNTFSQGIVSNAAREFSATPVSFIQFDAAISSGSSGGALINTRGEAIGVTAATVVTGQNLNLAIPINLINELSDNTLFSFTAAGGNQFDGEIELSSTDVTVKAYSVAQVTVTDVLNNCDTVAYQISNDSVVGCRWEGWTNNLTQNTLSIKGFTPGTATITVYLLDAYDNILASDVITVTVTEGQAPAVTFYASHYPVVDLGAYEGVRQLDHYAANNRIYYLYDAYDFYGDIDDVFDRYAQLLMDRGFYYSDTETVGGTDFDKYASDDWWVAFGLLYSDSGDPYVEVIIF